MNSLKDVFETALKKKKRRPLRRLMSRFGIFLSFFFIISFLNYIYYMTM